MASSNLLKKTLANGPTEQPFAASGHEADSRTEKTNIFNKKTGLTAGSGPMSSSQAARGKLYDLWSKCLQQTHVVMSKPVR